jgi:hypothetical protein
MGEPADLEGVIMLPPYETLSYSDFTDFRKWCNFIGHCIAKN